MRMTRQRGPASYPGYPVAMGTAASSILCPFHKVTITYSKRSCQRSEMPPSIPCEPNHLLPFSKAWKSQTARSIVPLGIPVK
ncbi:Hypothetical Protein CGB_D1610C [Cryptococcus gattii WM276]|uniref:Uncharacterized protein n=1 Tax=Cryptococcus gattii serotype B (strain WM276 / ATCC MYA-4071) TaxID=367775 RepID=E6R5K4_CRYGW|nr:Hypothetical Protein CGB_D1610C [Cryptococcus gattii WM276]ADV21572.1 Hypothetical Protein CGB_D1610C [Cryptococcus gattii WM276]